MSLMFRSPEGSIEAVPSVRSIKAVPSVQVRPGEGRERKQILPATNEIENKEETETDEF